MGLSFHLLCAPLGCKFVKFHPYTVDFSVANTSDPPVDINIHHVWVTFFGNPWISASGPYAALNLSFKSSTTGQSLEKHLHLPSGTDNGRSSIEV
jgi:hypothetical protein